jgi:hypothetical protein
LTAAQQVWVDQVFTIDLFTFDSFRLVAPWVQNFASYGGDSNYLSGDPGIATTYVSER